MRRSLLREVAGLSYAEIARHLSVSVNAVQMLSFPSERPLLPVPARVPKPELPKLACQCLFRRRPSHRSRPSFRRSSRGRLTRSSTVS